MRKSRQAPGDSSGRRISIRNQATDRFCITLEMKFRNQATDPFGQAPHRPQAFPLQRLRGRAGKCGSYGHFQTPAFHRGGNGVAHSVHVVQAPLGRLAVRRSHADFSNGGVDSLLWREAG